MATPRHTYPFAQPGPRRWKTLVLVCTACFMPVLGLAVAAWLLADRDEPAVAEAKPAVA